MYFSDYWQRIFAIDNSFLIWGALFVLAIWLRSGLVFALAGAALLHLAFDFPLHHDDARAHFWPLTMWKFESPVSYWDPEHYGWVTQPLEIAFALILSGVLWRRYTKGVPRVVISGGILFTLAPAVLFYLIF